MSSINDPVTVCNRALAEISAQTSITAIGEDSNEGRACGLWFDTVRRQFLQAAWWGWAQGTANLALLKSAPGTPETPVVGNVSTWSPAYPPPPWLYAYGYPSDCIQMRWVTPQWSWWTGATLSYTFPVIYGSDILVSRFEITTDKDAQGNDTKCVLSNMEKAISRYTRNVTDLNQWDEQCIQSLVSALAARLAVHLTGDKALAKMKAEEANRFIVGSRASDGNEGLTIQDVSPDWIAARGIPQPGMLFPPWAPGYGPLF